MIPGDFGDFPYFKPFFDTVAQIPHLKINSKIIGTKIDFVVVKV